MPIKVNSGRQSSIWVYQPIAFSDMASGVAQAAVNLPVDAVVVGGALVTTTAFNSATSDTLNVGDSASATRYASAADIHAAGRIALTLTGYKVTAPTRQVLVTWTGTGTAPTAGEVILQLEYIVSYRADAAQD